MAAGVGGAILIATAILAFALGKHPVVAGTNSAAPIFPILPIDGGQTRCQTISRLPGNATHVRLVISAIRGAPGNLRVKIGGDSGNARFVGRNRVGPAGLVIRLEPPTRPLHPARMCLRYTGRGQVVLAGERKRAPADTVLGTSRLDRRVPSVAFLRPGLSSWASRRHLIADRYVNSQASPFGGWSLWVGIGAAIGAALLALYWLVFRLDAPNRGRAGEGRS
jgi:hypothetical protein